jgi:hypothetical protein
MSKNVAWPTLTTNEGWVLDPARQLNLSFAHTLTSDRFQSIIYSGKVTSLMNLLIRFQHDPDRLMDAIIESYTNFYNRIFDSADVDATYTMNPDESYSVQLSIIVTKNGTKYSLAYTGALDKSSLYEALKGMTL